MATCPACGNRDTAKMGTLHTACCVDHDSPVWFSWHPDAGQPRVYGGFIDGGGDKVSRQCQGPDSVPVSKVQTSKDPKQTP